MAHKLYYYRAVLISLIMLTGVMYAWAADDATNFANKVNGKYTVVYYPEDVSAADLIQKLNMRTSDKVLAGAPLGIKKSDQNELVTFLDSLFMQVSDILEMHIYSMQLNVKVLQNADKLKESYATMFNSDLMGKQSFYVYQTNTVYVSQEAFKREIIGHEMAHAIISHYFVIPAPVKIQEVLSMYVEYNLRRTEK